MTRLAYLLERYGEAVTADLAHEYPGVSVGDIFTGARTVDEVMTLVDLLPRTSRLAEAIDQDDELAEIMAGTPVADEPTDGDAPRRTEFTLEAKLLTELVNRVSSLLEALGSMSGQSLSIPPLGGPVGARERLAARREDEQVDELVADIQRAHEEFRAQQAEQAQDEQREG